MEDFLSFIEMHLLAILTILGCLVLLLGSVQWVAWIFSLGRFGKQVNPTEKAQYVRYLVADGLVKIINDFRHLLALLIVLIFGFALAYSLWRAGSNIDSIKEVLQAVAATLGGLVGSIIGYYFGESAGRRSVSNGVPVAAVSQNGNEMQLVQETPKDENFSQIRLVVPPASQTSPQSGDNGDNPVDPETK